MTMRADPLRRKGFPLYPPATDGSGHQQSASRVPLRVPEGLALDARRDRHRRPFLRGPRFFLALYLLPLSLALALSVLDPRHARRETRRRRTSKKRDPYRSPHHPPPSGTAETNHGTAGAQSATRSPSPRANAADAQEPEPPPHQHAPGEVDGETAGGQGPRGRTTNTPPGRRERTSAAERRANAPRPEPHRPEETANTVARGNAPRTTASTPAAHPTATGTPGGTAAHAPRAATQSGPPETREPENPTTDAPRR